MKARATRPVKQRGWWGCKGPGSVPVEDRPGWVAPCPVCKCHHLAPTDARAKRPKEAT